MSDLQRYEALLAQRAADGRIPSTREPLPIRSLAEVMVAVHQQWQDEEADSLAELVVEHEGRAEAAERRLADVEAERDGQADQRAELTAQLAAAERRLADMQVVLNATKARLSVAERIERRARDYRRLIEQALHLRMHGERAPGGDETWAQWDRNAEAVLRAALDGDGQPSDVGPA